MTKADPKTAKDYRPTVFLPETAFPMRAGLPQAEPKLLERWERLDLYAALRRVAKGRRKFVLHDGPPYANGHLHSGHALNKILKDVITKSQQMMGRDSNYVPGWDCHGLPIEWKIEERYRAAGQDKDAVPIAEFRRECRAFADHWINIQREEFKRLGVIGDWKNPYTTMSFPAEAQIVRECLKFLMNGGLYQGSKPVMWSVVEKTALAEAEIEYHDHVSTSIHVRFPVVTAKDPALDGAGIVIWTTTPWTMPANRAIAVKADADYVRLRVDAMTEKSLVPGGAEVIVAAALADAFAAAAKIASYTVLATIKGEAIAGSVCAHPLRGQGYDFDVPVLAGDFVTLDQGTGFVHIAPGHGEDDFELGRAHGIQPARTVAEDGSYYDTVPLFAGRRVLTQDGREGDANAAVMAAIGEAGHLFARARLTHSYPHSWRSKAPLIFRNTPQWFISMAVNDLREKALKAIEEVRWVPKSGRNRIHAMIAQRPDWVISRQRAWGVPITVFVDKKTGEPLRDPAVNDRIVAAVAERGADAWFDCPPQTFLGEGRNPDDYLQVTDILDVWFDSGSTHSFVLEQRPDLQWPASLYLEGTDQHRGWFHSSLLESCGTRGRAPYEAVLTHGFVLDGDGLKMSKSSGNGIEPQQVIDQSGADILRLWVVSSDYAEDVRIGPEIIKTQVDAYRRLRNTLRYLLGALSGFDPVERLPADQMPELERYILHRLAELDALVRETVNDFEFHRMFLGLHQFCAVDLSAFYFDVRKDALYCDAPTSARRRAVRTVMEAVFERLVRWLAPVLSFTAEEAWLCRHPSEDGSVHLETYLDTPSAWLSPDLAERWGRVRELRRAVTGALELERAAKRIGSSLQAHPTVHLPAADRDLLSGIDFAEVCIVSGLTLTCEPAPDGAFALADLPEVAVVPGLAEGEKCQRCWKVLPEVGQVAGHDDLCGRCAEAIA